MGGQTSGQGRCSDGLLCDACSLMATAAIRVGIRQPLILLPRDFQAASCPLKHALTRAPWLETGTSSSVGLLTGSASVFAASPAAATATRRGLGSAIMLLLVCSCAADDVLMVWWCCCCSIMMLLQ